MRKPSKPAKALKVAKPAVVVPPSEEPLDTICEHCFKIFPYATLAAYHVAEEHSHASQ